MQLLISTILSAQRAVAVTHLSTSAILTNARRLLAMYACSGNRYHWLTELLQISNHHTKFLPPIVSSKVNHLSKWASGSTNPSPSLLFKAGKPWASFAEMFQFDPNWNGTMTRGGWTIHNIHLLDQLIQMAVQEYIGLIYSNEPNYFNKRRYSVNAYYQA